MKTYLVGLFACVRCILYPGTKIVAFSATFKQGKEIVLKITDDFMIHSPFLRNEISKTSTGLNDCGVWFKNGSWIQVRVAAETSRGKIQKKYYYINFNRRIYNIWKMKKKYGLKMTMNF